MKFLQSLIAAVELLRFWIYHLATILHSPNTPRWDWEPPRLSLWILSGSLKWVFIHFAVNYSVPGQSCCSHDLCYDHSCCCHPSSHSCQSSTVERMFSSEWFQVYTYNCPHSPHVHPWDMDFATTVLIKKKWLASQGKKKIIILLLSACHMTLVCLIFSATLLSYFINQKLRAKKERQRWNITLFHTHKSTFPLTTAWQFLLVITFPSFSLGGQVVMGREELGIKTCLPKILVLIISWSQVTFFININLYVLVVS